MAILENIVIALGGKMTYYSITLDEIWEAWRAVSGMFSDLLH